VPEYSMSMRLYPALFILSPLGYRPQQIRSLVQFPFASNAEVCVQLRAFVICLYLVGHVTM